jgi:hypothetical protein
MGYRKRDIQPRVKDGRYYLCVDAENSCSSSVVLVAEDQTKIQTVI